MHSGYLHGSGFLNQTEVNTARFLEAKPDFLPMYTISSVYDISHTETLVLRDDKAKRLLLNIAIRSALSLQARSSPAHKQTCTRLEEQATGHA